MLVRAIRVGKMFSRGPVPDILDEYEKLWWGNEVDAQEAS